MGSPKPTPVAGGTYWDASATVTVFDARHRPMGHPALGAHLETSGGRDASRPVLHPGHPTPVLSLGGIPSNASCVVVLVRSANYAKQSIVRSLVARQRILPSSGAPRTRLISHRLSCCSVVPDLPPFFAPGCSSHTSPVRRHVPTEQSCKFVEAMAAAHWYGGRVRSIAWWSEMAEAALTVNSLADCYDLTLRRRRSARRAVAARHIGGREPCAPSR